MPFQCKIRGKFWKLDQQKRDGHCVQCLVIPSTRPHPCSKRGAVACLHHLAAAGIGTILSLLWLSPMWCPDCIMKLDGENAQMLLRVTLPAVGRKTCRLNLTAMCFLFLCVYACGCVCGCVQEWEREQQWKPTGFNVPWHVLLGQGGVFVDKV